MAFDGVSLSLSLSHSHCVVHSLSGGLCSMEVAKRKSSGLHFVVGALKLTLLLGIVWSMSATAVFVQLLWQA